MPGANDPASRDRLSGGRTSVKIGRRKRELMLSSGLFGIFRPELLFHELLALSAGEEDYTAHHLHYMVLGSIVFGDYFKGLGIDESNPLKGILMTIIDFFWFRIPWVNVDRNPAYEPDDFVLLEEGIKSKM